jgi:high affinity cGMP-specific 3',5'-cyclic phosphodiesterase 9
MLLSPSPFDSQVQVTKEVRDYLKKPTFDNWQWDDPEMMILLRQMFLDLQLPSKFNIDVSLTMHYLHTWIYRTVPFQMETLHAWLFEIYKHYNDVPFHNFKHCFMVTQMVWGQIDSFTGDLHTKVTPILFRCMECAV